MPPFLTISDAARYLGVCPKTLGRWDAANLVKPTFRTLGAHRRYDLAFLKVLRTPTRILSSPPPPAPAPLRAITYARVSSAVQKQRGDLQRQVEDLQRFCHVHQWQIVKDIQDVGSGVNDARQGDQRYAYKTDILFGGFRELDLAPIIEKLDSYQLLLVGSFHTHGATRTQRYAHAFPSVADFEFAALYELKMLIIGERLDERRSEVLFLFPKYAKAWEAVLESKIMDRIAYPCPYRVQSSIFEVADEDTPPKEFCTTCPGLWKEDPIDALFNPYFIMLKVELPDFYLLWANGSLDGVVEVS